jgi:lauroyl/myristoyl acyltransferase
LALLTQRVMTDELKRASAVGCVLPGRPFHAEVEVTRMFFGEFTTTTAFSAFELHVIGN